MNTITTFVSLLAATASLAPFGAAPVSAQASASRGPGTMDVAGVRLGMSVGEAEKALSTLYRCERNEGYQSFGQMVRNEVATRQGRSQWQDTGTAIGRLACKGPNDEDLLLILAQTPSGGVVDKIQFSAQGNRIDVPSALKQLSVKYGPPTQGIVGNGAWCTGRCQPLGMMEAGPRFSVTSSPSFLQIIATRGNAARAADEAALKAAADRAAPPSVRPAF